jgi:hypothetical protein
VDITFYETFGDLKADGECTALREGLAELAIGEDTLLNAVSDKARCQINGCDYVMAGPVDGTVWEGTVNANTRHQRKVRFLELLRQDGKPSSPRIVLLQGHLQRGEAVMDVQACTSSQSGEQTSLVCFTFGSLILTAFGDLPVQDLRVGDLVHTADNGLQPIRWIGSREVTQTRMQLANHLQPVKICKDAFGIGLPVTDIWVSQEHRLLIETQEAGASSAQLSVLSPARSLVNGQTILVDVQAHDTLYTHLLFDEHQVIFANNMPAESFYPCPRSLLSLTEEDRKRVFDFMPHLENHPLSYGGFARKVISAQDAIVLAA